MGLPLTKTVTIVWDGAGWRDQQTGVLVEGVQRLYDSKGGVTAVGKPTIQREGQPMDDYPWYEELDARERVQVNHARSYAKNFNSAGVPGHSQHMLIAKLAKLLDTAQVGMYPPSDDDDGMNPV